MSAAEEHPIVLFDGCCGLCNRFVDRLLRADRSGVLRFAPIQGETARRLLPPLPEDPAQWSIVLVDERGVHQGSDACVRLCRRLGGAWALLGLARFVPRWPRERAYRWIARRRYRWFGRRATCRVPSAGERERFLP